MFAIVQTISARGIIEVYTVPYKWLNGDGNVVSIPTASSIKAFNKKSQQQLDPQSNWLQLKCTQLEKNFENFEAAEARLDHWVDATADEAVDSDEDDGPKSKRLRRPKHDDAFIYGANNLNDIAEKLKLANKSKSLADQNQVLSTQLDQQVATNQLVQVDTTHQLDHNEVATTLQLDHNQVATTHQLDVQATGTLASATTSSIENEFIFYEPVGQQKLEYVNSNGASTSVTIGTLLLDVYGSVLGLVKDMTATNTALRAMATEILQMKEMLAEKVVDGRNTSSQSQEVSIINGLFPLQTRDEMTAANLLLSQPVYAEAFVCILYLFVYLIRRGNF